MGWGHVNIPRVLSCNPQISNILCLVSHTNRQTGQPDQLFLLCWSTYTQILTISNSTSNKRLPTYFAWIHTEPNTYGKSRTLFSEKCLILCVVEWAGGERGEICHCRGQAPDPFHPDSPNNSCCPQGASQPLGHGSAEVDAMPSLLCDALALL